MGTLYAGGSSRGADVKKKGLMVVDLTGFEKGTEYDIQAINNIAMAGFPSVINATKTKPAETGILHFYIKDMGVPTFSRGYWDFSTSRR